MTRFTIGRLAKAANVNVETIRFYERRGLVAQPPRPAGGGAREYDGDTVARIRFVRQAQEIGFSLRQIAELLSLRADPQADCADVRVRAIEKRDEVLGKITQLARMRDALEELIASCPGGGEVAACTILEAMARGSEMAASRPQEPPSRCEEGKQAMKTTILTVGGMHCDGCARTIEALLGRVPGVVKAEASFDKGQARVLHERSGVSGADLAAAVAKGGFKVEVADQ